MSARVRRRAAALRTREAPFDERGHDVVVDHLLRRAGAVGVVEDELPLAAHEHGAAVRRDDDGFFGARGALGGHQRPSAHRHAHAVAVRPAAGLARLPLQARGAGGAPHGGQQRSGCAAARQATMPTPAKRWRRSGRAAHKCLTV